MSVKRKQASSLAEGPTELNTKGRKRKPRHKLTPTVLREALRQSHGWITPAAEALGVDRSSIYLAIKRFGLEDYLQEVRETFLDKVEAKVAEAALAGRPWAAMFVLKTLGRHRGYVERQEVAQVGKLEVELVEVPHDGG